MSVEIAVTASRRSAATRMPRDLEDVRCSLDAGEGKEQMLEPDLGRAMRKRHVEGVVAAVEHRIVDPDRSRAFVLAGARSRRPLPTKTPPRLARAAPQAPGSLPAAS